MGSHSISRQALAFALVGLATYAHADTWVCAQPNGHRVVATVDPKVPHWECSAAGGTTRLSAQKLNADCVPLAPMTSASCRLLSGDANMGLRAGMGVREVLQLYGAPQARDFLRSKNGTAVVWLYAAQPGPQFRIVFRDAVVSEWGLMPRTSSDSIRVTRQDVDRR